MDRYYSLSKYLTTNFGQKLMKISLNIGCTCPNRDGTIGFGGCSFCSEGGSGDFASDPSLNISSQIDEAIDLVSHKSQSSRYIAYLQAYTNTYGNIEKLSEIYHAIASDDRIAVISIATRSDCLGEDVLQLLSEINRIKPVWIEIGFQTMHESTHDMLNTGFHLSDFEKAVYSLKALGIPVIAHMIIGLPYEDENMILASASCLADLHIDGVKLQLLHVLKNTRLGDAFEQKPFHILSEDEYVRLVIQCLEVLPEDTVIHRLTGDGPRELLIAPLWSLHKRNVLNAIAHEMKIADTRQGRRYHGRTNNPL